MTTEKTVTGHKLFVYGTLRPGTGETVEIPGSMYDLGWFPGVKLGGPGCNSSFRAEIIEVSDYKLKSLDSYEGFRPDDLDGSLYLRVPYEDGWVYVYNKDVEAKTFIPGGDWLSHRQALRSEMVAEEGAR
jgi:gamma-glutamylcyclotransferase (GGCT)/AIG2-like uncharacterized protein YtfP